ncbi:MAG: LytR family transcriptional regulator [Clostridiales bacterium]|nr:LytR family transcriptional regulator [Clostridiales bacterium]
MKKIDWKISWRKLKYIPKSTGLRILMLVTGLAEVLFLVLLFVLNVLPFTYVALILLVLFLVDAIMLQLMNGVKHRRTKTLGAMVIAALILNVLLIGDVYVYSTYDTLQKISAWHDTWEYYDVVALKEGSYNKIGDVKGQTVYTVDMESKQLTEASERLITKEEVELDTVSGLLTLGQKLVDDGTDVSDTNVSELESATEDEIAQAAEKLDEETKKDDDKASEENADSAEADKATATTAAPTSGVKLQDNIILVSHSGYKLIKSNIKGFKKNTEIVYKIKVKKRGDDTSRAVDVTKDSFNVLISGLDSWGTIDEGGLSDVNMVMTVNPQTRQILLTSIPRDSYIPLHSYGAKDKLTHSGIYGQDETRMTIEDFLDIEINYTIRVNFSMLVDLINAIDGIDVYSDYAFESAITDWTYEEGWNHCTGKKALYFARERKAFSDGDMQRNKNQQKVLEATLKKVTSSKVIMTRYTKILDAVEDEMWTDMSDKDLRKLAKMQLRNMSKKWTVEKVNVTGSTGGAPCFSMGNQNLSCVFPTEESVEKAKSAIHDIMYPVENAQPQSSTQKSTEASETNEEVEE